MRRYPQRLVRLALLLACLSCTGIQNLPAQEPAPVPPAVGMKLVEAATRWKAQLAYEPLTGTGHILRGQDLVRFKLGYPVYAVGTGLALEAPAVYEGPDGLLLPVAAYELIHRWFADRDDDRASRFTVAAILIDPGHGGKDPGAVGDFGTAKDRLKLYEKDVVLDIGLDVYERLSSRWPGKTIMITRKDDSFPTLD